MQEKLIREGAELYKTPLYILDEDALEYRVSGLREIFKNKVGLCYAMKANAFITRQMSEMADRIEVCSEGEFRLCRALRISPEKLYVSGVLKREAFVSEMLEYGKEKAVYTAESPSHLRLIRKYCEKLGIRANVFLRLTSGNQFGMDKETVENLFAQLIDDSYVHVSGIHFFSGTQKKKVQSLEKELEMLDEFCSFLERKYGQKVEELEYGPGFFIGYFTNQKEQLADDAARIAEVIEGLSFKGKITLEMGRAFASSCGLYVTRVWDCKSNDGKNYCIVDGGIHQIHYDGQIRGMYHPEIRHLPDSLPGDENGRETGALSGRENGREAGGLSEGEELWNVCGSLCTVNDVLVSNYPLTSPEPGDLLVFEKVGAYSLTEGMSLFLSHELPAVALYSKKKGWSTARRQMETFLLNSELCDRKNINIGGGE